MKSKGKSNKCKQQQADIYTKKDILSRIKVTEDITEILEYTTNEDNDIRLAATSQLCPCKVQEDVPEFWDRVFQLVDDPQSKIRARVLHIICDGSPNRLQNEVMDALYKFNRDSDQEIRRQAHKVLAKAQKGTWNVL
ncbi:unnamed protein product (macronuclear) [Paramecium tetraurelia]|uniref:Condensin complex subunit 1 C-terminal domain-containing protein n=1 Tax=Paramecium tetraurelia TaxID=5888 RepID=A0DWT1_PARTE|nr:uncharacterized protein GSPATT00021141001 [Paramecium tetraurelia]CAK87498.1 unnamed protein product [Paramecium tetraurelia]|eukprot:XP_001454895.1 hypothetical protein (macronuclear) [Paramecium tetraurelia strain d4-2]